MPDINIHICHLTCDEISDLIQRPEDLLTYVTHYIKLHQTLYSISQILPISQRYLQTSISPSVSHWLQRRVTWIARDNTRTHCQMHWTTEHRRTIHAPCRTNPPHS